MLPRYVLSASIAIALLGTAAPATAASISVGDIVDGLIEPCYYVAGSDASLSPRLCAPCYYPRAGAYVCPEPCPIAPIAAGDAAVRGCGVPCGSMLDPTTQSWRCPTVREIVERLSEAVATDVTFQLSLEGPNRPCITHANPPTWCDGAPVVPCDSRLRGCVSCPTERDPLAVCNPVCVALGVVYHATGWPYLMIACRPISAGDVADAIDTSGACEPSPSACRFVACELGGTTELCTRYLWRAAQEGVAKVHDVVACAIRC